MFHSMAARTPVTSRWSIFCICSAGELGECGHVAKLSQNDKTNYLDTHQDLVDCWAYFEDINKTHADADVLMAGAYEVLGEAGSAKACLDEITKFFQHCKERDSYPIIYYTGHGEEGTGNWCFPCGGRISFQEVLGKYKAVGTRRLSILSDACFSGKWVRLGQSNQVHVCSASGETECAKDRLFAQAVFRKDSAKRIALRDDVKAQATQDVFHTDTLRNFAGFNKTWLGAWSPSDTVR